MDAGGGSEVIGMAGERGGESRPLIGVKRRLI